MSSHGSSSKEDKQPGENDGGGKLEACKRKRNQISILEYFSKRKKAKKEEEIKGDLNLKFTLAIANRTI